MRKNTSAASKNKLTSRQVAQFERDGFLAFPSLFSQRETTLLRSEALAFEGRKGVAHNTVEADGTTVRTALAIHQRSPLFARLGRHPRIIEAARTLLGGQVYLHQFKLNFKAPFDGGVWDWHQDFGTWHVQDGMPRPQALTAALFLDDVSSINGPLMFIPGSHKKRLPAWQEPGRSYPLFTLDPGTVERLAKKRGIVAPEGPAGSVLFFHCNLAHASGSNLTPWGRMVTYLCLNLPRNRIRRPRRPEWVSFRNFSPVVPLADNCLVP